MNSITSQIIKYLLKQHFRTKRAMAEALGIGYRTFLNICAGQTSAKVNEQALLSIIRYCIQHDISLEPALVL